MHKKQRAAAQAIISGMNNSPVSKKLGLYLLEHSGRVMVEDIVAHLNLNRRQITASVSHLRELKMGIASSSRHEPGSWYELTMNEKDCAKRDTYKEKCSEGFKFVARANPPTPDSVWPWLSGNWNGVFCESQSQGAGL